jgi:flagellar capping protein FliD
MGVVEETRQVVQDFLAPELREMRGVLSSIDKRLESMDKRLDSQDKRLDLHEEAVRARFDNIIQRLETMQQSFAFDKRLSDLEADKRRSA